MATDGLFALWVQVEINDLNRGLTVVNEHEEKYPDALRQFYNDWYRRNEGGCNGVTPSLARFFLSIQTFINSNDELCVVTDEDIGYSDDTDEISNLVVHVWNALDGRWISTFEERQ
jgi:hypothetical protein